MTAQKKSAAKEPRSFEKSLDRLESLVGEMEGGDLGLEEMIGRFEEGQGLIKFCSAKLAEVEKKIERLVKKGESLETEPFDDVVDEDQEEEDDEKDELF